jgi:ribosomal protein S18 acetylase RimI-like enzyme
MTALTDPPTVTGHGLHVERIDAESIEYALGPLDAAARWLAERGIEQWPMSFTESPERAGWLREQAGDGNVFVWTALGSHPIATITVTPWQDPDFAAFWPDRDVHAQYIARFAVAPTGRRLFPGLGGEMLKFAAETAAARGADVLRLDCAKRNERLQQYYLDHGFVHVHTVDYHERKSGAMFERRLP